MSETISQFNPEVDAPTDDEYIKSRALFENYLSTREAALRRERPEGEALYAVQESARAWIEESGILAEKPDYEHYDEALVQKKIGGLVNFLRANHSDQVSELELQATELFIKTTFGMYQTRPADGEAAPDADGSFAFVVPARMSRHNTEYGEEVEPAIPAFRYLPNELRAQMMTGIAPFIIDVYKKDACGKRGYLVFAPIFGDMMEDYQDELMEALRIAQQTVNDTVDFAQERLGVELVGLGATLPAITNFGKAINNEKVITTTGHGGTVQLIKETVRSGILQGYTSRRKMPDSQTEIGVIGLGSIGSSIAHLMADDFKDSQLNLYDKKERRVQQAAERLAKYNGRIKTFDSVGQLINQSDVIVSAVTSKVPVLELGLETMADKFVVDDSQPGAFDPNEVEQLNGRVAWVIGTNAQNIERHDYDYATMHDPKHDIFGCEAEVAALSIYAQELRERGMSQSVVKRIIAKLALQESVTPKSARLIGALFKKYDISAAPLQAFGKLIEPPSE